MDNNFLSEFNIFYLINFVLNRDKKKNGRIRNY